LAFITDKPLSFAAENYLKKKKVKLIIAERK
jgi:hypothetical protein